MLISGRLQLSILLILMASILLCGCITNSATDNTTAQVKPTANISTNATPVPSAVANNSVLPAVPVKNTSTATPTTLPSNKTKTVSNDFAPGLPPAVIFSQVPAYGSSDLLKGNVTGVDHPENYKLAIFVNYNGWYNVPSSDVRLTNVSSDGSWTCDISRGGIGTKATEINAFLVPVGFVPTRVSGRYGLPADLKGNATAVNGVIRKVPLPTP